jgi:hypothetical protein
LIAIIPNMCQNNNCGYDHAKKCSYGTPKQAFGIKQYLPNREKCSDQNIGVNDFERDVQFDFFT